jgi:DNA-binding XRE family transcriptional regulator
MSMSLSDLDRIRPVDPVELDAAVRELDARERAWQLKELRAQTGMSQAEMAEVMAVKQNRVSQIESGGVEHARLETMRRYAEALGGRLSVEITLGDKRYLVAGGR